MTLFRKLFKHDLEPDALLPDSVIEHMWSDLGDVLAHYRALGIQVDAEFPQEQRSDDHDPTVDLDP